MTDTDDPSQFRQMSALRDGRPVLIRAARADDRERLVTAFQGLDRQTIYTRYFSFRKDISETEFRASGRSAISAATSCMVGDAGQRCPKKSIIAAASCVVTDATPAVPTADTRLHGRGGLPAPGPGRPAAGSNLRAWRASAASPGCEADVLAEQHGDAGGVPAQRLAY